MTVSIEQAQRELAELLGRLGKGEEMILTREGRPFARIVQDVQESPGHLEEPMTGRCGWGKDLVIWVSPDFDAPLDDFKEYME